MRQRRARLMYSVDVRRFVCVGTVSGGVCSGAVEYLPNDFFGEWDGKAYCAKHAATAPVPVRRRKDMIG